MEAAFAVYSLVTKQRKKTRKHLRKPYIPALRYVAPKVITIDEPSQRRELLEFLGRLRYHYKHKSSLTLLIDFTNTTRLVCSGTLLLYAEPESIDCLFVGRRETTLATEPISNQASQVLKQVGIYQSVFEQV